jgi:hypothetical protein
MRVGDQMIMAFAGLYAVAGGEGGAVTHQGEKQGLNTKDDMRNGSRRPDVMGLCELEASVSLHKKLD